GRAFGLFDGRGFAAGLHLDEQGIAELHRFAHGNVKGMRAGRKLVDGTQNDNAVILHLARMCRCGRSRDQDGKAQSEKNMEAKRAHGNYSAVAALPPSLSLFMLKMTCPSSFSRPGGDCVYSIWPPFSSVSSEPPGSSDRNLPSRKPALETTAAVSAGMLMPLSLCMRTTA